MKSTQNHWRGRGCSGCRDEYLPRPTDEGPVVQHGYGEKIAARGSFRTVCAYHSRKRLDAFLAGAVVASNATLNLKRCLMAFESFVCRRF